MEIDRNNIGESLSVAYTMGQVNIYMEIIRELKEIPEENVINVKKTIGLLQDKVQMLLALNPKAMLEIETERAEGLDVWLK